MKKCVCGRMKDDDAVFCPYCGSKEFAAEEPVRQVQPAGDPNYAGATYTYQQSPAPAQPFQEYAAPQQPAFQQVQPKPVKAKQEAPADVPGKAHSAKSILVLIFGICSLVLGGVAVRLGLGIAGMLMGKKEADNGQIFGYYGRKLSMIGIIVCIATIALLAIGYMLFSSYVSQVLAYVFSILS